MTVNHDVLNHVRHGILEMSKKYPITDILEFRRGIIESGAESIKALIGDETNGTPPFEDIWVTVESSYVIGAGSLALRAQAMSDVGTEKYSNRYREISSRAGYDIATAKVRRRAMYIPILGDEDTLIDVIAAAISVTARGREKGEFLLVKTMDRLKSMSFESESKIDWFPFGGRP